MPGLADLQSAFDAALRGDGLPPGLLARDPAEVERRFNVYRNNVAVSLSEALGVRFPVIRRLVGDAFFTPMARLYSETDRPRTPVLAEWGEGFADFLSGFEPLAAYPYMSEVARIEFARGRAFHAEDRPAATPEHFAGADPARLLLPLHLSVTVLRCAHPAVSIWTAHQPGVGTDAVGSGPEIALILRDRAFNVPVRSINAGDAAMIEAVQRGQPLLEAAERAQACDPAHDPQSLLLDLMRAGAIVAAEA